MINRPERSDHPKARGSRHHARTKSNTDEVGRLTYAFEEMRRALNDKLRSSTEINLSLEQEVTRRTAELERRNTELNTALAGVDLAGTDFFYTNALRRLEPPPSIVMIVPVV